MQDTVIKGTGNSRSISSVPNFPAMYPTYEAFAQALIAGEVPIDIGPLNPAGCDVVGTANNKANLLSDTTAALLVGLRSNPTVNDALASPFPKITRGSYVGPGRGTSSSYTDIILTCHKNPQVFFCSAHKSGSVSYNIFHIAFKNQNNYSVTLYGGSTSSASGSVIINDNSVSIAKNAAYIRELDTTYDYFIL